MRRLLDGHEVRSDWLPSPTTIKSGDISRPIETAFIGKNENEQPPKSFLLLLLSGAWFLLLPECYACLFFFAGSIWPYLLSTWHFIVCVLRQVIHVASCLHVWYTHLCFVVCFVLCGALCS
eukprot:GEMP01110650.1.p1 GENE.GEMP01110650.1~~GEMP01110650.1.p1  ORF type:complete len:121 (+),score=11.11 GEMP01110650.1:310-672(+)